MTTRCGIAPYRSGLDPGGGNLLELLRTTLPPVVEMGQNGDTWRLALRTGRCSNPDIVAARPVDRRKSVRLFLEPAVGTAAGLTINR